MRATRLRAVPDGKSSWVFATVGAVLIEFLLLGPQGPAGPGFLEGWSFVGNGLFVALLLAIALGAVRPLAPHLARALPSARWRWGFGVGWASTVAVWSWITATVSFPPPAAGPALEATYLPVVGAFGALPTLRFASPPIGIAGYLSPLLLLYGLLAFLWVSLVVLAVAGRKGRPSENRERRAGARALPYLAALGWAPFLGISTVCCVSPPVATVFLLLGGPAAWAGAYEAAGSSASALLLLLSLGLVVLGLSIASTTRWDLPARGRPTLDREVPA